MKHFSSAVAALTLASALVACGQQSASVSASGNDIPPANATSADKVTSGSAKVNFAIKEVGYTDTQGNKITKAQALNLNKGSNLAPQDIPPELACEAATTVKAYWYSTNAYGRIELDCYEVGGRFDSIGYATVRVTDPAGNYADGYKTNAPGGQHAEVLSGAVRKMSGRYVVQGTLEAYYSVPYGAYTRQTYRIEVRPIQAVYPGF